MSVPDRVGSYVNRVFIVPLSRVATFYLHLVEPLCVPASIYFVTVYRPGMAGILNRTLEIVFYLADRSFSKLIMIAEGLESCDLTLSTHMSSYI